MEYTDIFDMLYSNVCELKSKCEQITEDNPVIELVFLNQRIFEILDYVDKNIKTL